MTDEKSFVARQVLALGDRIALQNRLDEIEEALKWDEDPERRSRLRREYLDLTDNQVAA